MTAMPHAARLDLDEPIPYTLTPLAYAALDDGSQPVEEWSCQTCQAAYFGTPPDDGLCPACSATASPTHLGRTPNRHG